MQKKTKIIFFLGAFLALFLIGALLDFKDVEADNCPSNTEVGETTATLVGEVTDDGGDPNLTVWFRYGRTPTYGQETPHQSKYGRGLFCATIYNLEPGTTYYYQAMAQNSRGISYGENKSFTTQMLQTPSVDLKVNNSDGPLTLNYRDYVNLSWTSTNAVSCQASGDWQGYKYISGSESINLNSVKTYNFTITCQSSDGQTATDSVSLTARPLLPQVVTIPAIITY